MRARGVATLCTQSAAALLLAVRQQIPALSYCSAACKNAFVNVEVAEAPRMPKAKRKRKRNPRLLRVVAVPHRSEKRKEAKDDQNGFFIT